MLIVSLREGDYVMIGDNIKVHYDSRRGADQLAIGIEAPRDVSVLRGKLYEEGIAKLAEEGDEEALALSKKLKKEYKERRRLSALRQAKYVERERRASIKSS